MSTLVGTPTVRWFKKLNGEVILQCAREVWVNGNVRHYEWIDVPVFEEKESEVAAPETNLGAGGPFTII